MIDEVDREKITQYQMREGIMPEGFKFGVWTHHCTARLGRRIPEMFPKCILVSKAGIYLSTYATNGLSNCNPGFLMGIPESKSSGMMARS